jgi:DnaJ-class molecular chaperone
MNDRFDPYAELGLDRAATDAEVQRAYRERAKKTHPDKGGDPDAWASTCRALSILEDPKRRRRYDQTGSADDVEPDNLRASALQIVENFIGSAVDAFLDTGRFDPRHAHDLFPEFIERMGEEIGQAEEGIAKAKMVKVYLRDLASRFSSPFPERPIERLFETRQRAIDAQIVTLEDAIAARKLAVEIAEAYDFDPSTERDVVSPVLREPV